MTTPTGLEPTQTRRPWRATFRTAVAVGIPAILLLPTIIQMVVDEFGKTMPAGFTAWLLAAGAIITALASLITRILALPQVELLLRQLPGGFLAAQPRPKPTDNDDAGEASIGLLGIVALLVVAILVIWAPR